MRLTYKISGADCIFFITCLVNEVLRLMEIEILNYLLFFLLLFFLLFKKLDCEKFLLYALFIPHIYLQFLAVPIFQLLKGTMMGKSKNGDVVRFIIYIFFWGIVNCAVYDGFLPQVIFQAFLYYCILSFAFQGCKNFDMKLHYTYLNSMFVFQIAVGLMQLIYNGHMGDGIRGTFVNAHYYGIFLLIYILLTFSIEKHKSRRIIKLIFTAVFLCLSDAKHVWMLFVAALLFVKIMKKIGASKNYLLLCSLGLLIGSGIVIFILDGHVPDFLSSSNFIAVYVLNNDYNKKVTFFINTFRQMLSWNGLFGFGVGLYGSQIAISMGKGIIHAWDSSISMFSYIAEPYRNAISGLMTYYYDNLGIRNSSMVLGYPLVSYGALIGELGIIGYIWFTKLLEKAFRGCDRTLLVFFLLICIFDTYLEIPSVFVFIMIAASMTKEKEYT